MINLSFFKPESKIGNTCEYCKTDFPHPKRKFCSKHCRRMSRRVVKWCEHCEKEFSTTKSKAHVRCCSVSCGQKNRSSGSYDKLKTGEIRDCLNCEKQFYVRKSEANKEKTKREYCSINCRRKHKAGDGMTIINSGYRLVRCPPEFEPMQGTRHSYILEHRLIMARHLGRLLKLGEKVYHIDGKRGNNNIDNLSLSKVEQNERRKVKNQEVDIV